MYEVFPTTAAGAADAEWPLAVCGDGCQLRLPAGSYRVRVSGPPWSSVRTSERTVDLSRDAQLMVDPPSTTWRTTGLVAGIAGLVAVQFGVGLAVLDLAMASSDWRRQHGYEHVYAELGAATAGAVVATVGWIAFANNARPTIKVTPGSPAENTGLRLGPARLGSGWGLSGSIAF